VVIDGITNTFTAGTNWTANSTRFVARSNLTTITLSAATIPVWVDRVEIIETGNRYYLPEESLGLLEGERAIGEWRLEFTDSKTGAIVPPPDILSWRLDMQYATPVVLAEPLQSNRTYPRVVSVNQTNRITPGTLYTNQTHYFMVPTCPDTTLATVTLTGSNNVGQLELLVDRSGIPTGNPETDDYVLLLNTDTPGNTKNGSAVLTITTTSPASAPLQPGKPFFIAVRNHSVTTTNSYLLNVRLDRSTCLPRQSTRLENSQAEFSMLSASAGPGAPPDSEGELYSVEVGSDTPGFRINVQADGDVAILARKDEPPTTAQYSHIEDTPRAGQEQLQITTASSPALTPGTWYVLVLNKEPFPVTYTISAANPLGPVLNIREVNDHLELSWLGATGQAYMVQSSVDLRQWNDEQPFTGSGAIITYTPPTSGERLKFYRVVTTP
jgi:hypothetical protein